VLDTREAVQERIGEMETSSGVLFDVERIREILPHRYPFLLVDRILEFEPAKRCVGIKNVTANEKLFKGHFPGDSVPGVILVEAIAQVGCVLLLSMPEGRDSLAYFAAMENVRFLKPVRPGDTLVIETEAIAYRRGIGKVKGSARVNGEVVCHGEFTCALVDRNRGRNAKAGHP